MTSRRACSVPFVASVMSFSMNGRSFLGLFDGRDDPLMAEQRHRQIAIQRQAMRGVAAEFPSGF